jgi:hypothetical protein
MRRQLFAILQATATEWADFLRDVDRLGAINLPTADTKKLSAKFDAPAADSGNPVPFDCVGVAMSLN